MAGVYLGKAAEALEEPNSYPIGGAGALILAGVTLFGSAVPLARRRNLARVAGVLLMVVGT